ncbi:MAG TPA: hypothetical protein VIK31_11555 [Propionibacteriaceae bacterium]
MPTSTAPTRRRRRATADELLAPAIHRHDSTYGKVTTEHGTIGADEPVIVFRAKDKLLPALLDALRADVRRCRVAPTAPQDPRREPRQDRRVAGREPDNTHSATCCAMLA